MNTTEVRDFGDRKTLVVYTEDNQVYRRFKQWKSCQQVIPYYQNGRVVGTDLYFPKQAEVEIRKVLGLPINKRKATPKQLEALAAGRMKSPVYRGNRGLLEVEAQAQG